MMRSMTGYGVSRRTGREGEFVAEVKSVNNRYLDMSVRLPRELGHLEPLVRDEVKRRVQRGKVDVNIRWVAAQDAVPLYEINTAVLRHYAGQVRDAFPDMPQGGIGPADLSALLTLPGAVNPAPAVFDDGAIQESLLGVMRDALDAHDATRRTEGGHLADALRGHVRTIVAGAEKIRGLKDLLLEEHKTRLREKIDTLCRETGAVVEPGRVEAEIVFYADKCDITEELVRLEAHTRALLKLCDKHDGPAGKSMEFLAQELLREVNTIGNKARRLEIASCTVEIKAEIEKIREQVQNIE